MDENRTSNYAHFIEDLLLDLAKKIVSFWPNLAIRLKLERSDIDAIELDVEKVQNRAFKMLMTWKEQVYEKANAFSLCQALLEEKRRDIALEIFGKDLVRNVESSAEGDTVLNQAALQ